MAKTHPQDQFGVLARDGRGQVMDSPTGFITVDASATPNRSAMVYSSTVITLAVPDNARQLMLFPTTALRVSEDPAMGHWDTAAANVKDAFDVSLMPFVYIVRDVSDGLLRFRFTLV